jgi:hypothetical protein
MPLKTSLYDAAEHQRDNVLHTGFSYEGQIFKKSMSNFLFRTENAASILEQMEAVVFNLIESVKTIKTFCAYALPKNYRKFN